MGLGRREFLRLTSLALAGLAFDASRAVVINENVYVNKKLGILFHKPVNWGFIAVKDFGKIKNNQVIGKGLEQNTEKIWEELGDPICMMTKYYEDTPENTGIFSPTITVNITPKEELADMGYDTFKELMEMSQFGVSQLLKDFRVIRKHELYQISKCNFYEYDAEYMFEHVDIKDPLKVELKVLKAEHNGFYYDFNCHQSKAQKQVAATEFAEFKHSIKLI